MTLIHDRPKFFMATTVILAWFADSTWKNNSKWCTQPPKLLGNFYTIYTIQAATGWLQEKRGYSKLKREALDRPLRRIRFGRGYGPVIRHTTDWMNGRMNEWMNGWTNEWINEWKNERMNTQFTSVAEGSTVDRRQSVWKPYFKPWNRISVCTACCFNPLKTDVLRHCTQTRSSVSHRTQPGTIINSNR